MVYFGVLLGIGIMGGMVYIALDKKSSFLMRIVSLVAIALMMATVIVCLVIIFTDNRVPLDPSTLIVGAPVEVKKSGGGNTMTLLLLIIFLIGIFILIAILAMRENRRQNKKDGGSGANSANSGFKL